MKVIILAGGLGTRLYEYTKRIPKPMVKIDGNPMLIHIMSHYIKYGFKDFASVKGRYKRINVAKEATRREENVSEGKGRPGVKRTKAEREAKLAKTYLGNVKVVWTNGDNVATAPRDNQPQAAPAPAKPADLPF